jgi:hypothetical protein
VLRHLASTALSEVKDIIEALFAAIVVERFLSWKRARRPKPQTLEVMAGASSSASAAVTVPAKLYGASRWASEHVPVSDFASHGLA